jgi:hypothetical protein
MRKQMIDVMFANRHPACEDCTTLADAERAQIRAPHSASPPAPPVSTTELPAANGTPPDARTSPSEPPEACPQCRCTNLVVIGDYRKCRLCAWVGKADRLLHSAAPATRDPPPEAATWQEGRAV